MKHPDYSIITEVPGLKATQEQLQRLYHRYHFAKKYCINKRVLEVACGSGIGLSYLADSASEVSGGDIDESNLLILNSRFKNHPKIKTLKMDAHYLNFPGDYFDAVILFEAIYYLTHPEQFIAEAHRVLKPGGVLIICSVNINWKDFHPSPFVQKYYSADVLASMLRVRFPEVSIYGAFRTEEGIKSFIFSIIKRIAVHLHLIPRSLKLRAFLKNIFIGKTIPMPADLNEGIFDFADPHPLNPEEENSRYKIIYWTAVKH